MRGWSPIESATIIESQIHLYIYISKLNLLIVLHAQHFLIILVFTLFHMSWYGCGREFIIVANEHRYHQCTILVGTRREITSYMACSFLFDTKKPTTLQMVATTLVDAINPGINLPLWRNTLPIVTAKVLENLPPIKFPSLRLFFVIRNAAAIKWLPHTDPNIRLALLVVATKLYAMASPPRLEFNTTSADGTRIIERLWP